MSQFLEASKRNLLPLSQENTNFNLALREWEHNGEVVDHLTPEEVCELCNHANLRYHFAIVNRLTNESLQVGSSCIEKFNITVFDEEGNALTGADRKKKLKNTVTLKQKEMMLEPLYMLYQAYQSKHRDTDHIQKDIRELKKKDGLSPQKLLSLFRQLQQSDIFYVPQLYKITLRSTENKQALAEMSDYDRGLIWLSLSPQQRIRYPEIKADYEEKKRQQEKERKKKAEEARLRALRSEEVQQKAKATWEARRLSIQQRRDKTRQPYDRTKKRPARPQPSHKQPQLPINDQSGWEIKPLPSPTNTSYPYKVVVYNSRGSAYQKIPCGSTEMAETRAKDIVNGRPGWIRIEIQNSESGQIIKSIRPLK